jgi:hypothetical protein
MHVYRVEITISGNNDQPEARMERIIASNWQNVCEILAGVCRDPGPVIRTMTIIETSSYPFEAGPKSFPKPN